MKKTITCYLTQVVVVAMAISLSGCLGSGNYRVLSNTEVAARLDNFHAQVAPADSFEFSWHDSSIRKKEYRKAIEGMLASFGLKPSGEGSYPLKINVNLTLSESTGKYYSYNPSLGGWFSTIPNSYGYGYRQQLYSKSFMNGYRAGGYINFIFPDGTNSGMSVSGAAKFSPSLNIDSKIPPGSLMDHRTAIRLKKKATIKLLGEFCTKLIEIFPSRSVLGAALHPNEIVARSCMEELKNKRVRLSVASEVVNADNVTSKRKRAAQHIIDQTKIIEGQ